MSHEGAFIEDEDVQQDGSHNNVLFLDRLEEQRPFITPAPSWNPPTNETPLEELDIPLGDPRFGLPQLDFLEQEITRLNENARLRNPSRPPNKGRLRLGCVSTNCGTSSIFSCSFSLC